MAITKQPGQSFEANVTGYPAGLTTVQVGIYTEPSRSSTAVYGPSATGVEEDDGSYYKVDFEAPGTGGQYWLIWEDVAGTANPAPEELIVSYTSPEAVTGPTFASPDDVAARLGRELSEAEATQVDFLLLAATEIITATADKDTEWAQGLDVPLTLRFLCADMAARALSAPVGVQSQTEALGQYSLTDRFQGPDVGAGGLWLSTTERLLVRRTVWGSTSGSAKTESIVDDLCLPVPDPLYP